MPTRTDIITLAFQKILGLRPATAAEGAYARDVLESAFQGCQEDALAPWSLDAPPFEAVEPLAALVAAIIAPTFGMTAPEGRGHAKLRVMGLINPDNRREISDADYF